MAGDMNMNANAIKITIKTESDNLQSQLVGKVNSIHEDGKSDLATKITDNFFGEYSGVMNNAYNACYTGALDTTTQVVKAFNEALQESADAYIHANQSLASEGYNISGNAETVFDTTGKKVL